ncbi:hypothetical protein EDB84DRAFT_1169436 [Lactarius hengduanensis]|nr:hypothetical protein EDB84DRAFT_1169436 [Lactarius hengduanensis]
MGGSRARIAAARLLLDGTWTGVHISGCHKAWCMVSSAHEQVVVKTSEHRLIFVPRTETPAGKSCLVLARFIFEVIVLVLAACVRTGEAHANCSPEFVIRLHSIIISSRTRVSPVPTHPY